MDDLVRGTLVRHATLGDGSIVDVRETGIVLVRLADGSTRKFRSSDFREYFAVAPRRVFPAHSVITSAMIDRAKARPSIERDELSGTGANIVGSIGELAFAAAYLDDWTKYDPASRDGRVDFGGVLVSNKWTGGVEIKSSACPREKCYRLFVRPSYAASRSPAFYVQVNIDVPSGTPAERFVGATAYFLGFATHAQVVAAAPSQYEGVDFHILQVNRDLERDMTRLPWPPEGLD